MQSFTLDIKSLEEDFFRDCALIGISSTVTGTRLCWSLNEILGIDLIRKEQDAFCEDHCYPIYEHVFPLTDCRLYVFQNHCKGNILVPELHSFNYIIMLSGEMLDWSAAEIEHILLKIPFIQTAQFIDLEEIDDKSGLIL